MHAPRNPTRFVVTLSQRPDSVAHLLQTCFHLRRNERLREEVCMVSICLHLCTLRHYAIRADLSSFRGCLKFGHPATVGPAIVVEQTSFSSRGSRSMRAIMGMNVGRSTKKTSRNNLLSCEHANKIVTFSKLYKAAAPYTFQSRLQGLLPKHGTNKHWLA